LADERLRALAAALNRLDGFTRELVVLHHITHMDVDALGRLYQVAPARISMEIRKGERDLSQQLSARGRAARHGGGVDLLRLLAEYATSVQSAWARGLGKYALAYLAEWDSPQAPPNDLWRLN
jgi:hypothetical protein